MALYIMIENITNFIGEYMNKTVLITGASRGIGRAYARLFANEGFNVAINYFSSEAEAKKLEAELSGHGSKALAVKADVSDSAQVKKMIDIVAKELGAVDILVNNAGISLQKLFTDVPEDEADKLFDINVKGALYCTQLVLPSMIRKKQGKIINISSIWGITGASCEVHYSASKAALIGFTKALAKEVGPSNIQVNCVAPGVIDTDMNSLLNSETIDELKESTPLGRMGTAEEIAHLVLYLASQKADFITGQVISPNGGFVI